MKLMTEELDEYAHKIKETKEEILRLSRVYKQFFDRDIRRELDEQKLKLKKLKKDSRNLLYKDIDELRLLKKHFPEFLKELEKDPFISSSMDAVKWLLDFKELPREKAEKELESLRKKRKQLRDAKKIITSFSRVETKKLEKLELFKDVLKKDLSKEDLLEWMDDQDKFFKRKGWLVLLNYPFIEVYIKNYLVNYKNALDDEKFYHQSYVQGSEQGSLSESETAKDLKIARKMRKGLERKCKHMLYANTKYLKKLKSSKRFGTNFSNFEHDFFDSIEMKHIDEEKWVKQMKELLHL